MRYHHLPRRLVAAALWPALLFSAGGVSADVSLLFPIFGVLNGMQIVRLNAALTSPEGDQPCPISLAFLDSEGRLMGTPSDFELLGGKAVHADFAGNPSRKPHERLQLRAQVMYGSPDVHPGCRAGVLASVEIFDKATGATQIVLTNPILWEQEPSGALDFDVQFLPSRATTAIDCQAANVSIHFDIFDQAGGLRTAVSRPCLLGERYRVTLDSGPYTLRVQGLQGTAVCYEKNEPVTVQAGQTQTLSIIANQQANGVAQGCSYPLPPPPPR